VTRTRRTNGEALLVPPRNRRSKVGRITGASGKSADDERVADGPEGATRRGNARGGRGPRGSGKPPAPWKNFSGPCQAIVFGRCRSCCRAIVAKWYSSSYGTWRSHRMKMIFTHFAPKARRASRWE